MRSCGADTVYLRDLILAETFEDCPFEDCHTQLWVRSISW